MDSPTKKTILLEFTLILTDPSKSDSNLYNSLTVFLGIITPGISFNVSLYVQSNFANLCPSVATKDK